MQLKFRDSRAMTPTAWILTSIALGWFGLMILAPGIALTQAAFREGVGPVW